MEMLMATRRFYMQIINNLIVSNANFHIKKCNAFFARLICKFDVSMELITTTQKSKKSEVLAHHVSRSKNIMYVYIMNIYETK